MDMRSRLLALGVFALFAGVLAWGAYTLSRSTEQVQQELAALAPEESAAPAVQPRKRPPPRRPQAGSSHPDLMRAQVQRLAARVERLSDLLDKKTAEYNELKAAHDENVQWLRELLADGYSFPAASTPAPFTSATSAAPAADADMLAELQTALRGAREELAALEKEAALTELEVFDLEERRRYLAATAAGALVRTGAAAVPALADLMSDRRREIRVWAAEVLGEIGPDAAPAADVLHEALSDPDEDVRDAARRALRNIEGS